MKKRVVSVFFCLIMGIAFAMLRLFFLANDQTLTSGTAGGSVRVQAATSRGYIYDRNGLPFLNEQTEKIAVAAPTEQTPQLLLPETSRDDFDEAYEQLKNGRPTAVRVSNDIYADGIRMVHSPVRYSSTLLIPHLAGYCDSTGKGVCGLEKSFESVLATRSCAVSFPVNAAGHVLCGMATTLLDEGVMGQRGVMLTLDKRMQATVRDELLRSGIRKGAAVLLDTDTGEVRAMVSVPEFDVLHLQDSLQDADGPFLNRALGAVSVGSVYKMIVTAAMLESGVSPQFEYTCTGSTEQDGLTFHCHRHSGHGTLDMEDALANSCNTWFIHAARQIPVEEILNLSWRVGLGSAVTLANGIVCSAGVVPEPEELSTDAARANIAFGQGRLTAAPLQIAAATAVFANGGRYFEPRLVLGTVDDAGVCTMTEGSTGQLVVSRQTAQTVREMLVYTARQTKTVTLENCGGKTATAQSGVYQNGTEQYNTWYSGFFPADNPQYVLTILCEDGFSGAQDCTPVFARIAALLQ